MGRKAKPKVDTQEEPKKTRTKKATKAPEDIHELAAFVDYVLKHIDDMELSYYRKLATRSGQSLRYVVGKSLVDLFRIRDSSLNLSSLFNEPKS